MIQIKPISIWQNGKTVIFNKIDIHINFDDLVSKAFFYYLLTNEEGNRIEGNLVIDGEDYSNWNGENESTIKLVISKLGLSLA